MFRYITAENCNALICLSYRDLTLKGPILFESIRLNGDAALFKLSQVVITLHNHVEISMCHARAVSINEACYAVLKPFTVFSVNHNTMEFFFETISVSPRHRNEHPCYFQYFSTYNLDLIFSEKRKLNYSIIFNANKWVHSLNTYNLNIAHCRWIMDTAFLFTMPSEVNQRLISFVNETFSIAKKRLCVCLHKKNEVDCYVDQLGFIYPGQKLSATLTIPNLKHKQVIMLDVYDIDSPTTACTVPSLHETKQLVDGNCTKLNFTILQANENYDWCELVFQPPLSLRDVYYIRFHSCPAGFINIDGRCGCDPILRSDTIFIHTCDINDQTILRPANSWISAMTTNNTHSYVVSLNCPFDYCVPHSSHINLSMTSDIQCQFSRSNVLCGQCSHGLSTVFGSSNCKECSNFYLPIIIPVSIAGILLVLLLFFLNLTVVDGMINGFILYVNIVGINGDIFFHPSHVSATAYVFISIANLDVGIETCFYNGMDDYAKMWLQLIFPIYLIFIATLLIITSRYSTRIQRLTAHRALPVLATLYSYCPILRYYVLYPVCCSLIPQ